MAGEFGISVDEVITLLRQMDVPVRSHVSPLTDDQVARIRARWEREKRARATAPAAASRRRRGAAAPVAEAPPPVVETPVETGPARRRRRVVETPPAPVETAAEPAIPAEPPLPGSGIVDTVAKAREAAKAAAAPPVAPPEQEWVPRPLPSDAQLLADALLERATVPAEVARGVRAALRGPRQVAGRLGEALIGLHRICAEVGMNPRDRAVDTSKGRGLSVEACERMLWEAGFIHELHAPACLASSAQS